MSRHRTGDALIFSVATALVLVHALDDAFVGRGPASAPASTRWRA